MVHIDPMQGPASPTESGAASPDLRTGEQALFVDQSAGENAQILCFDDNNNADSSLVQIDSVFNNGLTPIAEMNDETTDINLRKKLSQQHGGVNAPESSLSPGHNTKVLSSDSKVLSPSVVKNPKSPQTIAERSQLLNIDDS